MSAHRFAFTGPARPDSPGWEQTVTETLSTLPVPDEVRTGGAYGVDTLIARVARDLWPEARHVLVVPEGCWFNEECLAWPGYAHEPVAGGYMARNDALVLAADAVVAFPTHPGEVRRSGTWATVRRARKLRLPMLVVPLGAPERRWAEGAFPAR